MILLFIYTFLKSKINNLNHKLLNIITLYIINNIKLILYKTIDKTTDKKDRELYTQINLIINILRDKNARKRYDYFLKVGVPKWRGTG